MILVTGGTGFIGSHLVKRLRDEGKSVRCLVRQTSATKKLKELGVELSYGDVIDFSSLRNALSGVEVVIHLVAIIREKEGSTFEKVNHLGTQNLVKAAQEAGVKHFIHLSALGAGPQKRFPYTYSKWQGEEEVRKSGLPFVILRPSIVFGPDDKFMNLLAKIVKLSPVIPIPGAGKTKFQPIWVEDVVTCILKSLSQVNTTGKTIAIGGPQYLSLEEIIDILIKVLKHYRGKIHVPLWLMKPIIKIMETIFPNLPVTSEQLDLLQIDNLTALDSVEKNFSFKPKSLWEKITYIK